MKTKINEQIILIVVSAAVVITVVILVGLFRSNEAVNNQPENVKQQEVVNEQKEASEIDNIKSSDIIASSTAEKCIDAKLPIKSHPTFDEVAQAGCGDKNRYIGKEVIWRAAVSTHAHTGGIRFWVIDAEHPLNERKQHGFFWGTFLVSGSDPRYTEQGLKQWDEKWQSSWITYIMDVYGGIDYNQTTAEEFSVIAVIDYIDCDQLYDGCYIETSAKKIVELK